MARLRPSSQATSPIAATRLTQHQPPEARVCRDFARTLWTQPPGRVPVENKVARLDGLLAGKTSVLHQLGGLAVVSSGQITASRPGHSGAPQGSRCSQIAPRIASAIEQIEAVFNLGAGFDAVASAVAFTAGMGEYAEVALVGPLAAAFSAAAPTAALYLWSLHGTDEAE